MSIAIKEARTASPPCHPFTAARERDTLLTPAWIAECVAQEVEQFPDAWLPENLAERLAAKADYLYLAGRRPGFANLRNILLSAFVNQCKIIQTRRGLIDCLKFIRSANPC